MLEDKDWNHSGKNSTCYCIVQHVRSIIPTHEHSTIQLLTLTFVQYSVSLLACACICPIGKLKCWLYNFFVLTQSRLVV